MDGRKKGREGGLADGWMSLWRTEWMEGRKV